RVEPTASESLADLYNDGDVVAELASAGGPRDKAPLSAGHVPREEVEAGQLHAGIGDGGDERVDLVLSGNRRGEGPPELDGVEARRFRRGRAVVDGQIREKDRGVDRVRHGVSLPKYFISWNLLSTA